MSHLRPVVVLAVIAVLVSGCGSAETLLEPPHPREEVNAALQRYPATITLQGGRVIERATEVRVGPSETEYVKRQRHTVPTAEVAEIKVHVRRGVGTAMFAGMLPGLVVMGSGVYVSATESEGYGQLVAGVAVLYGAAGLVVGGLLGSLIGNAIAREKTYVIYEGSAPSMQ